MTNKEAIANLNQLYGVVSTDIQRSLDVAIKALEIPQGDCISEYIELYKSKVAFYESQNTRGEYAVTVRELKFVVETLETLRAERFQGDLISREALKDSICSDGCYYLGSFIKEKIDNAPTVEPERPKGKWEFYEEDPNDDDMAYYKCSVCGRLIHAKEAKLLKNYPFCHCGADMQKGDAK